MTKLPKREDLRCDTAYDTMLMRDIPMKDLHAVGYTCRLCNKQHLVLNHAANDADLFFADLYIRCSEQCGGFVHMRVKV